jgi:hypothetical protein
VGFVDQVTEDRERPCIRVLERKRNGIANAETHARWAARRIRMLSYACTESFAL